MDQALRVTPAMEAGLTDHGWSSEELVGLLSDKQSGGSRLLIIKVALITCAFYMGLAVLLQFGLILITQWTESLFVGGKLLVSAFAVIWVVSFGLAWSIVSASIRAKFPH